MGLPFWAKVTVPDGAGVPAGEIVAVKVTDAPITDGLALEASVVVDGAWLTVCVRVPILAV
jgi:hypothetical protein